MPHMIGKQLEPFSVMGYHQGEGSTTTLGVRFRMDSTGGRSYRGRRARRNMG